MGDMGRGTVAARGACGGPAARPLAIPLFDAPVMRATFLARILAAAVAAVDASGRRDLDSQRAVLVAEVGAVLVIVAGRACLARACVGTAGQPPTRAVTLRGWMLGLAASDRCEHLLREP